MSDGQAAVLSADQREVLGRALADALSYRTQTAGAPGVTSTQPGCATTTPRDLELTDAYLALARELGIERER